MIESNHTPKAAVKEIWPAFGGGHRKSIDIQPIRHVAAHQLGRQLNIPPKNMSLQLGTTNGPLVITNYGR
jgi:hypothetical protein